MNPKISYSCMNNVEKIINSHNSNIREFNANCLQKENSTCNCRVKTECPVEGVCMTENVVYEATISTKENVKPKKFILKYLLGIGNSAFTTIAILSLMNPLYTKQHYQDTIGIWWKTTSSHR